ncbi:hypothetical protein HF086_000885 [Spodoptera exigua]|uniref:Uncharacterized protein n=1 Tax=Spodoptera exigua TaxID=7107 RepID=A0A922SD34_SPOEX|nr:hypothetical protein HF086_000885 [Spodoptera exigua]
MKCLEKEVEHDEPPQIDVLIIDRFFLLHTMKNVPKKFGSISKKMLQMVTQLKASRIDVIFDQYFTPSIKNYEHSQRFESAQLEYTITGPEQVRPSDFVKELKNSNFKEALVDFFILHWASDEMAPFIGGKIIHINFRKCHSFMVNETNKVISSITEKLSCPEHEEADTKIVYHACKINYEANIIIRTIDTDVAAIMLAHMHRLNDESQVWMLTGTGNNLRFLVLVSAGVYKRIQEAKGSYEQTNKQLAQIIVENFRKHDFRMVSQSVLEEIEQEFVSYCVKNSLTPKPNTHMSLLIRNFNFLPTVEDETPPTHSVTKNASVRFNPIVQSKSNTLLNEIDSEIYSSGTNEIETNDSNIDTNRSIESTSDIYPVGRPFDRDRKIKGYVDFSCYFENVAKARKNGTLPDFIK